MSLAVALYVDSVTQKTQNRHSLEFEVRHLTIAEERTVLERPSFAIKDNTIIFLKYTKVASRQNMWSCMD